MIISVHEGCGNVVTLKEHKEDLHKDCTKVAQDLPKDYPKIAQSTLELKGRFIVRVGSKTSGNWEVYIG